MIYFENMTGHPMIVNREHIVTVDHSMHPSKLSQVKEYEPLAIDLTDKLGTIRPI